MLVKYHITTFVAAHTSIPVPNIHAVVTDTSDPTSPVTCIVQDKVRGISLYDALPSLAGDVRDTITGHLSKILDELSTLDNARIQINPYDGSFTGGIFRVMKGPCVAKNTADFFKFFLDKGRRGFTPDEEQQWLSAFDMNWPHIFAHGDLIPENVFVDPQTGAVTGIIDWELAGWVPYFWNDYILRRAWWEVKEWYMMVDQLLPGGSPAASATTAFWAIWSRAEIFS
ncbi:kinase-like domain-containing protein [Mycena rosella]|uniref:Kinase-like domain-containing protein n=1 Tax=Mycena rosella TaxID=1033263 RepID=A0AAD7D8K5_MYCRO|nr:kinase-like domain-containing protein [Mycena rosella]